MCSLLCVCTREVEVGVRGQRGGGGGGGGGRGRRMSSLIFAEEDNMDDYEYEIWLEVFSRILKI